MQAFFETALRVVRAAASWVVVVVRVAVLPSAGAVPDVLCDEQGTAEFSVCCPRR